MNIKSFNPYQLDSWADLSYISMENGAFIGNQAMKENQVSRIINNSSKLISVINAAYVSHPDESDRHR